MMNPRILNALAVGIGSAVGYLIADAVDRRRAERRTLTESDQRWMASTHDKPADA